MALLLPLHPDQQLPRGGAGEGANIYRLKNTTLAEDNVSEMLSE